MFVSHRRSAEPAGQPGQPSLGRRFGRRIWVLDPQFLGAEINPAAKGQLCLELPEALSLQRMNEGLQRLIVTRENLGGKEQPLVS